MREFGNFVYKLQNENRKNGHGCRMMDNFVFTTTVDQSFIGKLIGQVLSIENEAMRDIFMTFWDSLDKSSNSRSSEEAIYLLTTCGF